MPGEAAPPQEERPEDFVGLEIPDRRIVQAASSQRAVRGTGPASGLPASDGARMCEQPLLEVRG